MKNLRVAILGATGLVGQEFIKVLKQRNFPMASLLLLASGASAGKRVIVDGDEIEVQEATPRLLENVDLALFSAGSEISRIFAPEAARAGVVVVDNSAAFRMEPEIPLVVPEVNPEDLEKHQGIIANPNCSTIQMVVALYPLHRVNPIKRIIVDTYQAVSGTGRAAIEELSEQAKLVLGGEKAVPHVYPHEIAFNVLPHIDVFLENGYSREEWKMEHETRKIMHAEDIRVSATCVRVPVYAGHSEAIHVEFAQPMSPEEARDVLSRSPGVRIMDDLDTNLYPHPRAAAGLDEVFVGRIRRDTSHPNGLAMWVVSDNLRKGAALNAVQIAEELVERGWL
ncbi:aspartate-semialdehyde dehydrogenase [Dehalococcoidia bacterium]|nr:aspartate-semialdehyde dehydrogenase [Dehalococcoidia bacterium]